MVRLAGLAVLVLLLSGCAGKIPLFEGGMDYGKGEHGEYRANAYGCFNPPDLIMPESYDGKKACAGAKGFAGIVPEDYPLERFK